MTHTMSTKTDRWNTRSQRLRAPIEAVVLPAARWGYKKERLHRSAAVERELAYGDYLHD